MLAEPSYEIDTAPKVTVLTCVYNGDRFLRDAVQSILDQDFRDFEYVVVDDGSTDDTAAILKEFAVRDRRIRPIFKEHTGIADSVNVGLAQARGTYVARMDADDVSMPYRLTEQVALLDARPDVVLVGGVAQSIDENGKLGSIVTGGRHTTTNLNMFPPKVAVSMQPLMTVRHEALIKCGGYRPALDIAEDYDLFLRLIRFGKFHNPDRVMVHYRSHTGSMSHTRTVRQERYSALAEVAAIEVHQGRPDPIDGCPPDEVEERVLRHNVRRLFEAYVRFRVWRRVNSPAARQAEYRLSRILRDAFSLHPQTLFSPKYHYLRYRILAGIARMTGLRAVRRIRRWRATRL